MLIKENRRIEPVTAASASATTASAPIHLSERRHWSVSKAWIIMALVGLVLLGIYAVEPTLVRQVFMEAVTVASADHNSTISSSFASIPKKQTLHPFAKAKRCALCFWGLPRSFSAMVLPSLVENVLKPNAPYQCDFFVHYHYLKQEGFSRAGRGGTIKPDQILELAEAVAKVARDNNNGSSPYESVVRFTKTTEEDFFQRRGDFINKTRNAKDSQGRYIYFPWAHGSFHYPTSSDNVRIFNVHC
jgi:hypothetical protein